MKKPPPHKELTFKGHVVQPLAIANWWVPGQAPEEYEHKFMANEAWRLEHIAQRLAKGGLDNPWKIRNLGKRIGCNSRYILRAMASPIMLNHVRDLIRMRAVYGVAKGLSSQIARAEDDPAAFKTLLQVGKVLEVGGGGSKAEVNVTIDRRNGGDNESAVQFIERFRERSRQGLLRKVSGEAEIATPDEDAP